MSGFGVPSSLLGIQFDLDLRAEACIKAKMISVMLIPSKTLVLQLEIFAEVAKIIRGGIRVEADLFKLAIEPTLALVLKGGVAVGGKLDLVLYPTKMCLSAFVESFLSEYQV